VGHCQVKQLKIDSSRSQTQSQWLTADAVHHTVEQHANTKFCGEATYHIKTLPHPFENLYKYTADAKTSS